MAIDIIARGMAASAAEQIESLASTALDRKIAQSVDLLSNQVMINGVLQPARENVVYMVKNDLILSGDLYDEYMLIDGALQQIGDTSTDLSDYYKKEETDKLFKEAQEVSIGTEEPDDNYNVWIVPGGEDDSSVFDPSNYYTKTEIDALIGEFELSFDEIIAQQEEAIALQEDLIGGNSI